MGDLVSMRLHHIIGIDPGLDGAIAVLTPRHELLAVYDMPTTRRGRKGNRRQVCDSGLGQLFIDVKQRLGDVVAVVEEVNGNPIGGRKKGAAGAFNFGDGFGVVRGCLATAGIRYTLVLPQTWKRRAGLIRQDKAASIATAKMLYPEAPLTLKKHDGRAEAILIACYGGIH